MRDIRVALIALAGVSTVAAKVSRSGGGGTMGHGWLLAALGWWPSFAFAFAVPLLVAIWPTKAPRPIGVRRRLAGGAILGALAYELSQGVLDHRQTFDWADIAAILAGVLLGLAVEQWISRADPTARPRQSGAASRSA